jgi:hypothetical protein
MRTLAIALLALTACQGKASPPTADAPSSSVPRAAVHATATPSFPSTIDSLASAPAETRELIESLANSIERDQRDVFLADVSPLGFAVDNRAFILPEVASELDARSVPELTGIECNGTCTWRVARADAKTVVLDARRDDTVLGSFELVVDDGVWGVRRRL